MKYLYFALLILFISGCHKEEVRPVISDSEYYFVRMSIGTNKGSIDSFQYIQNDSTYKISGEGKGGLNINFNAAKGAIISCKGKAVNLEGGTLVLYLDVFDNTNNSAIISKYKQTVKDGEYIEINIVLPK